MRLTSFLVCLAMLVLAVMAPPGGARTALTPAAMRPVLTTYADIAAASYRDSHQAAIILRAATAPLAPSPLAAAALSTIPRLRHPRSGGHVAGRF